MVLYALGVSANIGSGVGWGKPDRQHELGSRGFRRCEVFEKVRFEQGVGLPEVLEGFGGRFELVLANPTLRDGAGSAEVL